MAYIDACKTGAWTLHLWKIGAEKDDRWVRFRCRSWRHEGECRLWKGAQDFARIRDALKAHPQGKVYGVLTLDQKKFDGNIWKAYRSLYARWDRLRKRITREFGKVEYVVLVEQHRSGFPHLNVLLVNDRLARACEGEGWKKVRNEWVIPNAVECGFGYMAWIEPVRDEEALAGYCVKLLGHQEAPGAVVGEVAKTLQVPTRAPKHFRRLRASRGFLPPPHKNGEWTGILVKMTLADIEWLQSVAPVPSVARLEDALHNPSQEMNLEQMTRLFSGHVIDNGACSG